MKNVIGLTVLLAFFALTANAQFIKYGVKAGVNFANLSGDDIQNNNIKTSFHAGGVVEFILSDKFSFQPELLYSSQGTRFDTTNEDGIEVDSKITLDYLNLPLLGKFYVAEGFSLQAGPQIGFLLSAKSGGESSGISAEVDMKNETKNIDFGVGLGLGYALPSGLFFDARYNLGLSKLDDVDDNVDFDTKNSVIQISAGFSF